MRKIKLIVCSFIIGTSFVSCDDFLTLLPLNEVVLENYWTEKSDVESVLLGTYASLETQDCIFRMSMWGEMRSDNIMAGSDPAQSILNITKDNIIETNDYTSWACFYDVINRANTVLAFAPAVQAKDPNYTIAELRANQAEAIALRSLSYWYLIRAYKDVPFVTKPSIDDTENFVVPADSFDVILDQLIFDLDSVKDFAVNRYVKTLGYSAEEVTSSRITRVAIYAMLADMYLWRGDWEKSMECADFVIKRKIKEYNDIYSNSEPDKYKYLGGKECPIRLFNDVVPLISEVGSAETATGVTGGKSYNEIFGTGYSFESLLELSFETNKTENSFVSSNYYASSNGNLQNIGNLAPTKELQNLPDDADKTILFRKSDVRFYENIRESNDDYGIIKYAAGNISYTVSNTGDVNTSSVSARGRSNDQPTWVIYRLTDVVLMKAEAEVLLAEERPDIKDSLYADAFNLVQAVSIRSNYGLKTSYLKIADYRTFEAIDDLILKERRRELLFEGKRWFDLVRRARRAGNTEEIRTLLQSKHTGSNATFATKIKDMNYIYFPINKDELKINPLLKQNPAFKMNEDIKKN